MTFCHHILPFLCQKCLNEHNFKRPWHQTLFKVALSLTALVKKSIAPPPVKPSYYWFLISALFAKGLQKYLTKNYAFMS